MNLILQAIKSLFRKLEKAISSVSSTLSARLDKMDIKVKKAQTAADKAQTTADNAQTTANKQTDWDESDTTNPSYVKNRTHYKEDFMREFDTVYLGPLSKNAQAKVNGDIATALNDDMNNVIVEYRYDETSDWTVASAYKYSNDQYNYYSPEGTSLFWYDVPGTRFINNFTTSKPNLYLRFSGSVPDVRYVPLDERYLPDSTREAIDHTQWKQGGYISSYETGDKSFTIPAFTELFITGSITDPSSHRPLSIKLNDKEIGVFARSNGTIEVNVRATIKALPDGTIDSNKRVFCCECLRLATVDNQDVYTILSTRIFGTIDYAQKEHTITLCLGECVAASNILLWYR